MGRDGELNEWHYWTISCQVLVVVTSCDPLHSSVLRSMGVVYDHPSDEWLQAYCDADREHVGEIEVHLLECSDCAVNVFQIIRATLKKRRTRPMPIV
jgi:hypothetical protein